MLLGLLAVAGLVFAEVLLRLTTPGLSPESLALATRLARITWPSIAASGVSGLLTGIYHAKSRFGWPSVVPVVAAGLKPALGLIPNGTGNAFMKELGLRPSDWRKAIDIIAQQRTRNLDVGRLEATDGTWHFLNIVGMGFIAEIAATAARLKWLGRSAYTVATLLRLPRKASTPWTMAWATSSW
jgi:hypothetical protein